MGNTLWITVLFPLEDGAGDQLHLKLKGQRGNGKFNCDDYKENKTAL